MGEVVLLEKSSSLAPLRTVLSWARPTSVGKVIATKDPEGKGFVVVKVRIHCS